MQPSIRRLGVEDASVLVALRREALETEPLAFAASVADDVALMIESVRGFLGAPDTQAVYGAFDGLELVGMIGLVKATKLKQRHKAMIWGMYVQPRHRRGGLGHALLNGAIEQARRWSVEQLQLSVAEPATVARHLYKLPDFAYGEQSRARCIGTAGSLPNITSSSTSAKRRESCPIG